MLTLSRVVRFAINPPLPTDAREPPSENHQRPNGFAGVPAMQGLGRHYELTLTCRGNPDPTTGYLINIRDIDAAVRAAAIPIIERACREAPHADPASLLPQLFSALDTHLPSKPHELRWNLTPTYSVTIEKRDMTTAIIRQQFDFAAAHRLHAPALTDDENRRVFGRCNNPSGHGHNYRLEAAVAVPLTPPASPTAPTAFSLADLERAVAESVIDRFDHKHLNADTTEFATRGGVVSSVENIAQVCFNLLAPAIKATSKGHAALRAVTVWETDRTSATYPA